MQWHRTRTRRSDTGSCPSTVPSACGRYAAASFSFEGLFYYMLIIKAVGKVNKTFILYT